MSLEILPRKQKENNREYAYRILRMNIMNLNLPPGIPLNENELAGALSMSRTPVHESITRLKDESLINVYPQSGSRISHICIHMLKEGYFMRSVIEPAIFRQLAGNLLKEYAGKLQENLSLQKEAAENPKNIDTFFQLDDKFHQIIYNACGKSIVWKATKQVCSHYDRVRYLDAIKNHTELMDIQKEHETLYRILLAGCAPDFDLNIFYEKHLGTYKKNFAKMLSIFPQYFDV